MLIEGTLVIDRWSCGCALRRRDQATPRRGRASLREDRLRQATGGGGAAHVLAVLHQMIVLLEVVEDLADLIGLRVKAAHHLALLCQLMLTLLQGKHVGKRRKHAIPPGSTPPGWDWVSGETQKLPACVHDTKETSTYVSWRDK